MHAHLIEWYMLTFDGKPIYEDWPEFWNLPKDVVQVGAGAGNIDVAARFGPSLGRYLVRTIAMRSLASWQLMVWWLC